MLKSIKNAPFIDPESIKNAIIWDFSAHKTHELQT
jgi:hypothetical protein